MQNILMEQIKYLKIENLLLYANDHIFSFKYKLKSLSF